MLTMPVSAHVSPVVKKIPHTPINGILVSGTAKPTRPVTSISPLIIAKAASPAPFSTLLAT